MLKGINIHGLKKGTYKQVKGGAGIDSIREELSVYDISKFDNIIIYVGGNDASNNMTPESFEQKYNALISYIKTENQRCEIMLCELCPRSDVDIREFNNVIYGVALQNSVVLIELFTSFLKNGRVVDRYFSHDGIHLSTSGVKRMMGCINEICHIVTDFNTCAFRQQNIKARQSNSMSRGDSVAWKPSVRAPNTLEYQRHRRKPMGFQPGFQTDTTRRNTSANNLVPCEVCKKSNHVTSECFFRKQNFNGRCHLCGETGHKKADHFNIFQ